MEKNNDTDNTDRGHGIIRQTEHIAVFLSLRECAQYITLYSRNSAVRGLKSQVTGQLGLLILICGPCFILGLRFTVSAPSRGLHYQSLQRFAKQVGSSGFFLISTN